MLINKLLKILSDYQYHKANELCRKLKIEASKLRSLVNRARNKGYPIVSNSYGYRLARKSEKYALEKLLKPYVSRGYKILQTYYNLIRKNKVEILNEIIENLFFNQ